MKRTALLALAIASAVTLQPVSPEAHAVPVTITAGPTKMAFNQSYEYLNWSISGVDWYDYESCTATVENRASRDLMDFDFLDDYQSSGRFQIYDWMVTPGVHDVKIECDNSGTAVTSVTMKWASRVGIRSATRSAGRTILKGVVKRHDPISDAVGWSNARVAIQKRTSSGAWKTVTTVRSGRGGAVTAAIRTSRRITWRMVAIENPRVWGSKSAAVRR